MKHLLLPILLLFSVSLLAKTAREEIYENLKLSGNQYLEYPVPEGVKYTKAPKGYKPFYLSAYIRHGSRYLIGAKDYTEPQALLSTADSLGLLTEQGKYAKMVVDSVARLAADRYGELTQKGYMQHRGIATRMYNNFPEIFKGKGKRVDARSTIVIRCILSMMSECNTLMSLNPDLDFFIDASNADMYYMNNGKSKYHKLYGNEPETKQAKADFSKKNTDSGRFTAALFTSYAALESQLDSTKMFSRLMEIAQSMQGLDTELELFSIFTPEECYKYWAKSTFNWYTGHGFCPLSKNMKPYAQINLLKNIISSADEVIETGGTEAHLRFGHDGILLPLAALMNLDSVNYSTADPEELIEHWRPYNYFPMACNIQLIFFKSKKAGEPVLVKIMLNERECHLPLQAINDVFYKWDDVKQFYFSIINNFSE